MNETIVKQKYKLDETVIHNGREKRVTAFRFEIRPMGQFKIYELEDDAEPNHSTSDVPEHLIGK